jgi:hypothetical protein
MFTDYAAFHLLLGECNGNANGTMKWYGAKYPNRLCILELDRRLEDASVFSTVVVPDWSYPRIRNGRGTLPGVIHGYVTEEGFLDLSYEEPGISNRQVASGTMIDHELIWRAVRENDLHPCHVEQMQTLQPTGGLFDSRSVVGYVINM